jgi:hypothetical protein
MAEVKEQKFEQCYFCGKPVYDPKFKAHIDCAVNHYVSVLRELRQWAEKAEQRIKEVRKNG